MKFCVFFLYQILIISVASAETTTFNKGTVERLFQRTDSDLSGDIFLLPEYGNFLLDDDDMALPSKFEVSHISEPGKKTRLIAAHPITTHGFAWNYDTEIPLFFFDPEGRWIKKGQRQEMPYQQDIAPTLAPILDIPAPSRSTGKELRAIRTTSRERPKAVIIFVVDQLGSNAFAKHRAAMPYLSSLTEKAAYFPKASVGQVDVETVVGHAAVGTGALTRGHGVSSNSFFNPGTWLSGKVFSLNIPDGYKSSGFPGMFFAPTLGDTLTLATQGRSVNFTLGAAARAAIALGGHGALFKGGKKSPLVYLDDATGTFVTDTNVYALPESVKDESLTTYGHDLVRKSAQKKAWFEHALFSDKKDEPRLDLLRATPALIAMETSILSKAIDEYKIGADQYPDLLSVNLKATDFCGHLFGFESDECRSVLQAADAEIKTISEKIARATQNRYILVVTADHGVAPLPELSGASRASRQDLIGAINKEFSSGIPGHDTVLALTSSQVFLNKPALASIGKTPEDVARFLREYRVTFDETANVLAADWRKKGRPTQQRFFKYVSVRKKP